MSTTNNLRNLIINNNNTSNNPKSRLRYHRSSANSAKSSTTSPFASKSNSAWISREQISDPPTGSTFIIPNTVPSGTAIAQRKNTCSPLAGFGDRENASLRWCTVSSIPEYPEVYGNEELKDDPFFQNYTTPESEVLAYALPRQQQGDAETRPSPCIMAASGMAESSSCGGLHVLEHTNDGIAAINDINIAIIGAEGVGKSTLIQRALGLRYLPTPASSMRISFDNVIYSVTIVEIDLEAFDFTNERCILWPRQICGLIVPRLDGALILYDVMNPESISNFPQTLDCLARSSLPTIVVATNCENPPSTRQIDVEKMEAACTTCLEARQTSSNKPESARNALSSILGAIVCHRNSPEVNRPRRRAASSANLRGAVAPTGERPSSQQSKHSRAISDTSLMKGFPAPPPPNSLSLRPQPTGRTSFCQQAPVLETPSLLESPAFSKDTLAQMFSAGSSAKESFNGTEESVAEPPRPRSNPEKAPSAPQPTTHEEDVVAILRRVRAKQSEHVVGVTFDELVDRLVSQHMSRQDTNFQEVFLCLYRKFAAPGELLAAIVQRFEHAGNDPSAHFLIKTTNQLRILNVLTMWIDTFPGDFASPQTSHRLDTFITKLSGDISFQAAAKDLRFQSENLVMVNDDTGWAHCDPDVGGAHDSFGHPLQGDHSATDVSSRMDTLTVASDEGTEMSSRRPSAVPSSFSQKTQSAEDLAPHPTYHTAEDYEIEARTMTPRQTLPLTKIRYHIFMDTPDDDFAEEMTRIDWVMFSSIRIRDLVRHVSLSLDEKEKCRSLANVNRTINHFNHIARWVSNMILMRDKAKHRAQMLEKFMRIASKMRIMNNYNGLGAVIAGINGSAIHRLSQTRALISPEVGKRFMRLELLMGNQKSHFAYRLAWENSPMPRIPFIPLHRRDLVSAEEGSRTFVGKEGEPMRINWRKFEVLGEVILPIMRSQMNGYGDLKRRDQARELILDCRMPCDEEEIYQRSLAVESSNTSLSIHEFGKKKFPWFQK